jgi:NADH-quinone oxidoreductase subunit M
MTDFPLLTLMMLIPLLGVLFIMTIRGEKEATYRNARYVTLYTSIFTFALSVFMLARFDPDVSGFQFMEQADWLPEAGISYQLGIDGISLFFVLLTAFLVPVCIIASWSSVKYRVKEYMIAFLILEAMLIGTFSALDSILFFVFFEGSMIPMFIIIGVWGGERCIYASFKFFLYTFAGSVLMFLGMLALYLYSGTSSIPELMELPVPVTMQIWLWLAFFASFAVKLPMWPLHTWLPDAHVEAPTAGSVILAGILLKLGGYGFLRFSLPMFPVASEMFAPFVFFLSVAAIIYTSLAALAQEDMKKLIAYSSVAHMGFVTLGLFSFTIQGIEGAIFQMLSHGLISAALFLCVGVLYDRLHTRELGRFGGLVNKMPRYATVFMVFMLGAAGLPGTSGFVGEFLALLGTYIASPYFAVFAVTGVVLGAAYMLVLYRRIFFGPLTNTEAEQIKDLTRSEYGILVCIALLVIGLGIFPGQVLSKVSPSAEALMTQVETGLEFYSEEVKDAD